MRNIHQMQDKYHQQWERLGKSDPYWAVLTNNSKRHNKWNADEFFQTGESEIAALIKSLEEMNVNLTYNTAVDFGCGVGRLSRALAKRFRQVTGVDISSSMLDEARKVNKGIDNIEFVQNIDNNLRVLETNSIDFVYSNIVLQHMPRTRQIQFIKEFCRILCPGCVLVFQTPSSANLTTFSGWRHTLFGNRVLNLLRRIKYGKDGVMEIHTLAKPDVANILEQSGMTLLAVERYDAAGAAYISFRYVAEKAI